MINVHDRWNIDLFTKQSTHSPIKFYKIRATYGFVSNAIYVVYKTWTIQSGSVNSKIKKLQVHIRDKTINL